MKSEAITIKYDYITNVIYSDVFVDLHFEEGHSQRQGNINCFRGLWDTGANITGISSRVIQALNPQPFGATHIKGTNGDRDETTYLISLGLAPYDTTLIIPAIEVSHCDFGGRADVLIGTDVIFLGDMAITNRKNQTWFTFRAPSLQRFDFKTVKIREDAGCTCGSGRKYKNCCK
jgi:hypothetical protein